MQNNPLKPYHSVLLPNVRLLPHQPLRLLYQKTAYLTMGSYPRYFYAEIRFALHTALLGTEIVALSSVQFQKVQHHKATGSSSFVS